MKYKKKIKKISDKSAFKAIKSLKIGDKHIGEMTASQSVWEKNQLDIVRTLYEMVERNKDGLTFPRNQQIADHLGLTRTTVSNHLKAYREGIKANDKHRETLENYTELVLMHTLRLSRTQVAAQRLLLECAGLLDQQQSVTKQQEKQDIVINLSKDIALDVE